MAKKSLGQNFLHDEGALNDIVEAGELNENDTVVEIGPGKGALTRKLISKVKKLICIELDERLIPWLKVEFSENKHFEIHHENALKYIPPNEPYKVIANIPYYITSPLLNHFLFEQFSRGNPPELIVFTVQNEVADKIVAEDGKESVLSLEVKLFGTPEKIRVIKANAFRPAPNVDSAVIKIRTYKEPLIKGDLKKIFRLLHMSFAQKRKKLTNNLCVALQKKPPEIREFLIKLGINENIRAEALTMDEWIKIFNELDLNPHSS